MRVGGGLGLALTWNLEDTQSNGQDTRVSIPISRGSACSVRFAEQGIRRDAVRPAPGGVRQYVRVLPPLPVDGEVLLDEVEQFRRESLAEVYYEPFDINSKNGMYVREEIKERIQVSHREPF